jgi:Mn-containing catalase
MQGPWNTGEQWDRVDDLTQVMPIDGGDGLATVEMDKTDAATVAALAARTMSNHAADSVTGADLGAGPGAGRTSEGDMGGAADMKDAKKMADAMTVKP